MARKFFDVPQILGGFLESDRGHTFRAINIPGVQANTTCPRMSSSIGPPLSSSPSPSDGKWGGWGPWDVLDIAVRPPGNRSLAARWLRVAAILSSRTLATSIWPNASCQLDRCHGLLTAVMWWDSVMEEQRPPSMPKSLIMHR